MTTGGFEMRRGLLSFGICLSLCSYSDAAYVTAGTLRSDCSGTSAETNVAFQRCLSYLAAVHDLMQDSKGKDTCFPKTIPVESLVAHVLKFISKAQGTDRMPASRAV